MDLSRVAVRAKLKPRREPYWQRLAVGRFIGFRPSKTGAAGGFIARYYQSSTGRNVHRALGDFGGLAANERYAAAKKAAEQWFEHVGAGGDTRRLSVREACERYAKGRPDAERRFQRYVYGDPISGVLLHRLQKMQVLAWRERLEDRPALVTRRKKGTNVTRPRSAADVNRNMTALRAALNAAKDEGLVVSDAAWASALKPIPHAGTRRNLYLDRSQRQRLLERLPAELAPFVRALCILPLRPGALAALTVGDFDSRRSELVISRDKAGHERKLLLPPKTASLFNQQARGKLPSAPLFARQNGKPWSRDYWKRPIKEAAQAAKLPSATTAYTLRHSTITDLVTGGLDLLTAAQVSGTSVAMIEQHYGHLRREHAAAALATLVL